MAGEQMKVDYDRLGTLRDNLAIGLRVLENEVESGWDLQGAVGDARLASAAHEFRDSWDKHRLDIRDRLQWLHDSITNIQEQFAQVDADLANGITTPPPGSSSGGGRTPQAV